MLRPAEMGTRHGVYIADEHGRVSAFLQKPSVSELQAAGGLPPDDQVALDIGLLRFSPEAASRAPLCPRREIGRCGRRRSDKVQDLRQFLSERVHNAVAAIYDWHLAREGLRVMRR